jgi:hypothetical protein
MINFPILEQLDVADYGMFPGIEASEPGLHVRFQPGLTLILGANGLGKTTLVILIYRMLTGPYDIPGLGGGGPLGNIRLTSILMRANDRQIFAHRVFDNARTARACLTFRLGSHLILIERNLKDLKLIRFTVDGKSLLAISDIEEESFQAAMLQLIGVSSFGDWILVLRHLVFFFEDRRMLVWDASAQRQILRLIFLPVDISRQWTLQEREILEIDSRMRNLNAALTREERAMAKNEVKLASSADVRHELQTLEKLQEIDEERQEKLEAEVVDLEAGRDKARLRFLKVEQERESRYRELERAKLLAIAARFPDRSETARFIFAQLLTENKCLVCGNDAPTAAADYASRINHKACVVCGSDLADRDKVIPQAEVSDKRVELVVADLEAIEKELVEARSSLQEAVRRHESHFEEMAGLNAKISERSLRIDLLIRNLPPAETEMHKERRELASMRSRVEELRRELKFKRSAFRTFVDQVNVDLATHSEEIRRSFGQYAEGFLLEKCALIWSLKKDRLGETGDFFDFPAFELEMTGTDFPTPVRRSGPEQVSESQREFIDLSFRMALMAIGGISGIGSLVFDAPESSLDAVFSQRAATVLSRFASTAGDNRLVITSNLVDGQLIPNLISKATTSSDRRSRVVDLVGIAAPSAAVRELRKEYEAVRDKLLTEKNP